MLARTNKYYLYIFFSTFSLLANRVSVGNPPRKSVKRERAKGEQQVDAHYNFEQTCCESDKARVHLFSPFESPECDTAGYSLR